MQWSIISSNLVICHIISLKMQELFSHVKDFDRSIPLSLSCASVFPLPLDDKIVT